MTAPDLQLDVVVDRPPALVWDAVADPVRIAAYSPEASGVAEEGGTTGGPVPVGARFRGSNRNGFFRWSTQCAVVESRPGVAFAAPARSKGL